MQNAKQQARIAALLPFFSFEMPHNSLPVRQFDMMRPLA
jgi:hypothetical protein